MRPFRHFLDDYNGGNVFQKNESTHDKKNIKKCYSVNRTNIFVNKGSPLKIIELNAFLLNLVDFLVKRVDW